MCTFAVAETVPESNLTTYAQALLMIILRFLLAQTIELDKDIKFYAVFAQYFLLLDLNVHAVSSENYDAIIVERVNRYLNKGLKIFTQKRKTPAVSREAILLLIYAWTSCPVPLTDITRSMIVCGWELFPSQFTSHMKQQFSWQVQINGSIHLLPNKQDFNSITVKFHPFALQKQENIIISV